MVSVLANRQTAVRVLNLAWPVVVEQMLGTAVGLLGTYLVGHLGGAALAAVGLSSQTVMLLTAVFSAVGVGSTALIARHIGAGETQEAEEIAGQSLLLALAMGLLVALPCFFWGGDLLRALGGEPQVTEAGKSYLFAVGTTMPLMALLFVGNAVMRGAGDTRTPMAVMGAVNLVNAIVSWALIYGVGPLPALGVLGAGIGSASSSAVGGALALRALLTGENRGGLRVRWPSLRFHPSTVRRLLRIGLPSGAEQGLLRLAQLVMAGVVTQLGTAAYAGHQLGIQLLSVAFTPGFAFSVAATTMVGQELGRQSPRRARESVMASAGLALTIMCTGGLLAYLFAEPLVRFFTSDPEVIPQGVRAVWGVCADRARAGLVLCPLRRPAGRGRHGLRAPGPGTAHLDHPAPPGPTPRRDPGLGADGGLGGDDSGYERPRTDAGSALPRGAVGANSGIENGVLALPETGLWIRGAGHVSALFCIPVLKIYWVGGS